MTGTKRDADTSLERLIAGMDRLAVLEHSMVPFDGWDDAAHKLTLDADPVKRTRKRKPTLTTALKQAAKAGATVSGATIAPDGTISISIGKPAGGTDTDETTSPDPKWN
jgi:hypothetical protein